MRRKVPDESSAVFESRIDSGVQRCDRETLSATLHVSTGACYPSVKRGSNAACLVRSREVSRFPRVAVCQKFTNRKPLKFHHLGNPVFQRGFGESFDSNICAKKIVQHLPTYPHPNICAKMFALPPPPHRCPLRSLKACRPGG